MKLGLIARADNSGLGMQTWEFYRHMDVAKTLVVDISEFNNNQQYPERYPTNATFIKGFPDDVDVRQFLEGLDCVFIAEAAYNHTLYDIAREMGVKTAVQYNYEFMDWLVNPTYPKPDMFIAPSQWHYGDVDAWCRNNGVKHVYLHCPVDRIKLKFREIRQVKTFLHVAGKSASHDRNGTKSVIEAAQFVDDDVKIHIHFQGEQGLPHQTTFTIEDYKRMAWQLGVDGKITIGQGEFKDYQDVYKMGDVMLMPRRYGGNCLPLNEALSVGMPVIMTNIEPNNKFLPDKWLVNAFKINQFAPRTTVDIYSVDPRVLAKKINNFAKMDEATIMSENVRASNLAETISWSNLKYKYQDALEELCTQS